MEPTRPEGSGPDEFALRDSGHNDIVLFREDMEIKLGIIATTATPGS